MKKNKLVLIVLLVISLSGCQLAKKEVTKYGEDKLIGAFITTERLGSYDIEAKLNNKEVKNNGKIYAKPINETYKDENGNEKVTLNYIFEELDGISFFTPNIKEDGYTLRSMSDTNGLVSNVNLSTNVTDNLTEYTAECTIYIKAGLKDIVFYANPVYQEDNGDVYVIQSSGFSMMSEMEGQKGSQKYEVESNSNENGKSSMEKSTVIVNYEVMYEPIKTTIHEMNKDNEVLSSTEFDNIFPEEMKLCENTDYLIVEIQKKDLSNNEIVEREIVSRKEGSVQVYEVKEKGLIAPFSIIFN